MLPAKVTGSGKTEVYMQAMQSHLAKGRRVVLFGIGLTPTNVNRFTKRFSVQLGHSILDYQIRSALTLGIWLGKVRPES